MKYFWITILSLNLFASTNKIVYIISTPRSLGTAMFRMFENRDDFTGFMEPNSVVYKRRIFSPERTKTWFFDDTFKNIEEIKTSLFAEQEKSHVIVKDTGYTAEDFIHNDNQFIQNPDIYFVFLVRDPYEVQCSMYKKHKRVAPIISDYVGTKQLYSMYQKVKTLSPNKVHLVITDKLIEDPKGTIEPIFASLNIPFSEKSLSWDNLGPDFTGARWRTPFRFKEFRTWHNNAIHSTHISKPTSKKRPLQEDLFSHALTEADKELLLEINEYHTPYYNLFLKETLNNCCRKNFF